jgi:2-dehydropantoate 2-reductase
MKENRNNRIYIIGLGAIGCNYAAKLYDRFPESIKIIAKKKRIDTLKHSGVIINNKTYNFSYISPGEKHDPADLLIIAVKYPDLRQAITDIKGFIGKDTVIISLLNGILSEEVIGQEIGMQHMLYAYSTASVMRDQSCATGKRYMHMGKIVFGEKANSDVSARVNTVKAIFSEAGIPYEIPADMIRSQWKKFMMNTGMNQTSAILKASANMFQKEGPHRELAIMAANEVVKISQRCGVNLNQADIEDFITVINGFNPAFKTSMLQDVEAGRKTEVENFSGVVRKLGKKYSVVTPVNETMYYLLSAIEQSQDRLF